MWRATIERRNRVCVGQLLMSGLSVLSVFRQGLGLTMRGGLERKGSIQTVSLSLCLLSVLRATLLLIRL